ncbi:hypothetical protein [Acinetobacter sp. BHS4]|uniref:hypothetical protein n=1 Tax=Acinetobacter sp. BHS4 TaxID=2836181 RepID=UPI001BCC785E|nr:hypothetical protein [Acinetobacter sp. BHS4]QVR66742.1 hypothetical protein KIP84_11790 [Acinetobacter sp. BHS4]
MNNYKIKAKGRAESKEIQELFFELGFKHKWDGAVVKNSWSSARLVYAEDGILWSGNCSDDFNECDFKELTIPKLRDLVILHRNNVHDATHCDNQKKFIYLTSDQIIYYWDGEWLYSAINKSNDYENYITNSLTVIPKDQEITTEYKTIKVEGLEGLVDGKAALTAALTGETVQISVEPWEEKNWDTFNPLEDDLSTKVFFTGMSQDVQKVFFRIKPKTILINGVEVPAPFRPEAGEKYWWINQNIKLGYEWDTNDAEQTDFNRIDMGVWRTEEQIKQVVAALKDVFEVQS